MQGNIGIRVEANPGYTASTLAYTTLVWHQTSSYHTVWHWASSYQTVWHWASSYHTSSIAILCVRLSYSKRCPDLTMYWFALIVKKYSVRSYSTSRMLNVSIPYLNLWPLFVKHATYQRIMSLWPLLVMLTRLLENLFRRYLPRYWKICLLCPLDNIPNGLWLTNCLDVYDYY